MATARMQMEERSLRVYCQTHGVSFTSPQAQRILCENVGHELTRGFPFAEHWQYCCDCQNFWASEVSANGTLGSMCPVCDRRFSSYFACSNCKVISVESDDDNVSRKVFTIRQQDKQIVCAGCLSPAPSALKEHDCPDVKVKIKTALSVCPFCDENLSPQPNFTVGGNPFSTAPLEKPSSNYAAIATNAVTCGNCLTANTQDDNFCKGCGKNLKQNTGAFNIAQPQVQNPYFSGQTQSESNLNSTTILPSSTGAHSPVISASVPVVTKKESRLGLWVLVSLGAIFLIASLIYFASSGSGMSAITGNLDRAIERQNLINPKGASAYDYYRQLKEKGADQATLKKYSDRLLPILQQGPGKLIDEQKSYDPRSAKLSEWQDAQAMMDWAKELSPNDKQLDAKAAYCAGRVAYLNQNYQEAIRLWTRASELNPKWALPQNDMGFVNYKYMQDFDTARSYFAEASSRDSNWAVPQLYCGHTYYRQKNFYEARTYYEEAARLDPEFPEAHAALGNLAKLRGDEAKKIGNFTLAAEEYGLAKEELTKSLELGILKSDGVQKDLSDVTKELGIYGGY